MCAAPTADTRGDDESARRQRAIKRAKAEAARLLAKARALEAELLEEEQRQPAEPDKAKQMPAVKKPAARQAEKKPAVAVTPTAKPTPTAMATPRKPSPPRSRAEKPSEEASDPQDEKPAATSRAAVVSNPELADPEANTGSRFWRESSGFLFSAVFHAVVLIILGLTWMTFDREAREHVMTAFLEAEEQPLEHSLDGILDDLEIQTAEAVPIDISDPGEAALGEIIGIEADVVDDVGTVASVDRFSNIGAPWGDTGSGMARAGGGMGGAEFYGVRAAGHRFVFIVDNSLSMNGGQFEAACMELYKAVSRMSAQQQFYVFFFSDGAYPLFYPQTVTEMVPATTRNQYKLEAWLRTIELVLQTNARPAVEKALAMKPDAIYILTDGAFTDGTFEYLMKLEPTRTSIHTVGMELKPEHENHLKQIAKRHHGTYRLVHVDPRIKMLVGKKTRPTHRTPGPVWGTYLAKLGKLGGGKKGKGGQGKKAKK